MWKRCPTLSRMLYTIVCRAWSSTDIPLFWQQAIIIVIPKSDNLGDPSLFRPIALANSDGKIFFSLLSKRLTTYVLANNFVSTKQQKGFLPDIPGCLEHSFLTTSAIRDAKCAGKNITVSYAHPNHFICTSGRNATQAKRCEPGLRKSRELRIRILYGAKLQDEEQRSVNNQKYAPCIELECALASAPAVRTCSSPISVGNDPTTKAHVSSYIHNIDTAEQLSKLSKLQMQGCWSEWDSLMNIDFSWKKLTHGTSDGILKFLLNSTTNIYSPHT